MDSVLALWIAVVASGLYHGLNPAMGWPLAVSAALMERRDGALFRALGALSGGHLLAMLTVLLPFATLTSLVFWQWEIQAAAAVTLLMLGLWLAITKRHPRFLARVKPTQLGLWSFLIALAHGAALMLVPIYLGLCALGDLDAGHQAASTLMRSAGLLVAVALVHTTAMLFSGGVLAYGVYRWFGLRVIHQTYINTEALWAWSLVGMGTLTLGLLFLPHVG
ncbi:MAG: hypothetical protein ACU0CI_08560 [Shimia sp.]